MTVSPTPLHRGRLPDGSQVALFSLFAFALGTIVVVVLAGAGVFGGSGGPSVAQGSGASATQTRILPPFESVELAGSMIVKIAVGGKQSVVVHADDNLLRRVTTTVDARHLAIGSRAGSFTTKSPMYVDIAVPALRALTLSGDGVVIANGVDAPSFTVSLPGSGVVQATGHAERLSVTLDGSGEARLGGLVVQRVRAVVGGSGRIVVTATRALYASIPGSGAVVFGGNPPVVKTSVTGAGAIVRS